MDILQDTQIGADGLRHLIEDIEDYQDPAPFRRYTGPYANAGYLADRPLPSQVPPGFSFGALDEEGGSVSLSNGMEWLMYGRLGPVMPGEELASAPLDASTAPVSITTANTGFRILETTTASFELPDRPVRVETSGLLLATNLISNSSGILTGAARTAIQIRYSKDGWATSAVAEPRSALFAGTGYESCTGLNAMLPPEGAEIPLAPGDMVQVALFFQRTDTTHKSVLLYNSGIGVFPWLKVIAG